MAEEAIGGFFARLGIKTDTNAFSRAENTLKQLGQTADKVSKMIGVSAAGMLTLAKVAGSVETASLKMARSIGVSATSLDQWKIAAGVAGTNAGALVSSLAQVENKMQGLKAGRIDMGMASSLAQLGIGYGDFAKMNATQRMRSVFNKASGMEDQSKASLLIEQTLGSAGKDFYDYMKLSGKSLDSMLAQGKALTFQTEQSKRSAMAFNAEFNGLMGGIKSIGLFAGGAFGQALMPAVRTVKELIAANKELIQQGILGFAENVGKTVSMVVGVAGRVIPIVQRIINSLGGLDKIIVRIGIGIGAMKLAGLAGNIMGIVRSVGMLKGAMLGLGGGALFLLIDDIIGYFAGKESVTGYVLQFFDKLKEKFEIKIDTQAFKDLGKALADLFKLMTGSDSVSEGLKKIVDSLLEFSGEAIKNVINVLGELAKVLTALLSGDWDKAGKALKEFFAVYKAGLIDTFRIDVAKDIASDAYNKTKEAGGSSIEAGWNAIVSGSRAVPVLSSAIRFGDYMGVTFGLNKKEDIDAIWAEIEKRKKKNKVKDGIMRPDGSVIGVSPDDWVFAARNIGDMASMFLPNGAGNSVHAPSDYTINQTFNVSGNANPQAIRQAAYSGTSDALMKSIHNSQRIMQLMPGTK